MERTIQVRLPDVLARKLDRFSKAEGMNNSELVRQALRFYFAQNYERALREGAQDLRPGLDRLGVTAESAEHWYKKQRKKTKELTGAGCE